MRILINLRHPVLVFLLVLLVGALVGIGVFQFHYAHRFLPGTVLGGENIGGLTYEEVVARASQVADSLAKDGMQVLFKSGGGDKVIIIPSQSTGLTPDVVVEYFSIGNYRKAIDAAFAFGHTGSIFVRLKEQARGLTKHYVGEYGVSFFDDSIHALLVKESHELLRQPSDAHFVVSGLIMNIATEQAGEAIDVEAATTAVQKALRQLQTNRLQAAVTSVPAKVTKEKLETIRDFATALANGGLFKLLYRGKIVYLGGQRLGSWLTVDPGQPGVVIKVLQEPLKKFVEQYIDGDLPDAPINSRFAMQNGKLVEIAPGVAGTIVDVASLASQLEAILNSRYVATVFNAANRYVTLAATTEIPISFRQEYPLITSSTIAQYKITDLIGSAKTSFKGSSNDRIQNIKLGLERSSGVLIPPGGEFSLVTSIGEVSEETGFTKEYVIKGDRSIKEAGGGLCQLATTVFRGVLDAGLPITERQNHSYVVGYYGPGLDATIYGPHPDLKFVNDTGNYVLFQMRTEGTNLIAELYGTSDKRQATTTEPVLSDYIDPPPTRYIPDLEAKWGSVECHDQPRKGLTAVATTTVAYADGHVRTKVFNSVYTPWPKVCLVGIKLGK